MFKNKKHGLTEKRLLSKMTVCLITSINYLINSNLRNTQWEYPTKWKLTQMEVSTKLNLWKLYISKCFWPNIKVIIAFRETACKKNPLIFPFNFAERHLKCNFNKMQLKLLAKTFRLKLHEFSISLITTSSLDILRLHVGKLDASLIFKLQMAPLILIVTHLDEFS